MKLLSTLAIAALLSAGGVFAATTPATTSAATPTATPAAAATPATKHHSAMHCEKEAKAKKLTGDDEKKFLKDCSEGKAG